MPSYDLGEIMSIATADIGHRADIPGSIVSQRANMAYMEVAHASEHALTENIAYSSTTSGDSTITLPTDLGELINISMTWSWSTSTSAISSHKTLTRIMASEADAIGFLPVGEPQAYVPFNNWIELWPSPDSAYSLQFRYRSQVTDLSATTDVPSLSTPWRYAIVLKTEQLLHRYLGDSARAVAAEQEYQSYIGRLKSDEYRRQMSESPMGFRPVYGDARPGRCRSIRSDW